MTGLQKRFLVVVIILLIWGIIRFDDRISAFFGPHAGDACDGSAHSYQWVVIGSAAYLSCEADPTPPQQ